MEPSGVKKLVRITFLETTSSVVVSRWWLKKSIRYVRTHSILSNPLYVPGPHREKVKKKRVIRRKRERYRKNRGRTRKKEKRKKEPVRDKRKKVKETAPGQY